MAKVEVKKNNECSGKECECGKECKCCCCGCKGKLLKLLVLIIVFLAGIGCGCLICCCNGCKSHHHRGPAKMAMIKHGMKQPKNNVIVIRTDGDEIVPEVAKVENDFRNSEKPVEADLPKVEEPEISAPQASEAEAPAEPVAPAENEATE